MATRARPAAVRCNQVLDALGHAVIATDLAGVVVAWNPRAEQLYGWTAQEALGRSIYDLVVTESLQDYAVEIMDRLRGGDLWSGVFTVHRKDGTTFSALVTDTAIHGDDGQLVGIAGVSIDVAEAVRPFVQRSREAAVITDAQGGVRFATPAIAGLIGWSDQQVAGRSWFGLVHEEDRAAVEAAHAAAVAHATLVPATEHRVRRPDGTYTWVNASVTNLLDEPMVRGILFTLRDVSERRAWVDELTRRALHDPLTGLANRATFLEHLETQVVARNHRGALFYIDLDDFKAVNDRLGHSAGDAVLRAVAERLRAAVRPEDVCGRLGGDEFAVLSRTVSDSRAALGLTRRLGAAISQPVTLKEGTIVPEATIGVTLLRSTTDPDQVIRLADASMYRRKRRRAAARQRRTGRTSSAIG